MRNLDIADSRSKLEQYAAQSRLLQQQTHLLGELEAGGALRIASNPAAEGDGSGEALDNAAMEAGTD